MKTTIAEVRKLIPTAKIPVPINEESTFIYDLTTPKKVSIAGQTTKAIKLGIEIKFPKDSYGFIIGTPLLDTSTLFPKAMLISSDHIAELVVLLGNHGAYPVTLDAGTKVARLVCVSRVNMKINEVERFVALEADTTSGNKSK